MSLLGAAIWTFLFGLIGAVGTLVALAQRSRKRLAYTVISVAPLLRVPDGSTEQLLQVTYAGVALKDVSFIELKLWNSGNVPIQKEDYEHPVFITFGTDAEVIAAEWLTLIPDNLKTAIDYDASRVVIQPTLLNPGDGIVLRVVLTSFTGTISLDARVVGIRQIREFASDGQSTPTDWRGATEVSALVIGGVVLFPLLWAVLERQVFHGSIRDTIDNIISLQASVCFVVAVLCWSATLKGRSSPFKLWKVETWTLPWLGALLAIMAFLTLVLLPYVNSMLPR